MEDLTILLVLILIFCIIIYFLLSTVQAWKQGKQLMGAKRVMLVIAHPDDEVMFFGPTILGLLKSCDIYLLCMSSGDYKGEGTNRKDELYECCAEIGIPEQNILLIKHSTLRDDPNLRWREELVSEIVLRHVAALSIDTVITFDRYGVSGHRNHIALYYAMGCLAMEDQERSVYCLTSVNLMRKYSWFVDVPMSYLLCNIVYLSSPSQWFQLRRAMSKHESQLTWYRRLYILFSRFDFSAF
ncbi:N-acetylglucosaminyl-phosphatidylinositol de-N-acetylase isoform X2 [Eurytemora carolleeae]|uniref:N-acetylglucosaminyl-phosphatidylinositol de-N-acetylase isoform X2 n=1 Tax=Eurytemora carolleeae TaxID=1294199 RepID=UPI000C78CDC1|nr:N-acetylglucosaminyl-phosphatidylinositol de-N-acetylase isoform X2 [Eurytemora carolleeae]|eukprot:XP_023326517.1 N-acetylglucosaminyl-phosphatidylinositol de-N-acetylase-like isoform X2 [Eurytemora affinis]